MKWNKTMKYTVIAPVGDNIDALFVGIRDFPTARVILITPKNRMRDAEKVRKELDRFKITVQIVEIRGNIWEEMFGKIAEITAMEKGHELIVNTATGERLLNGWDQIGLTLRHEDKIAAFEAAQG